MDKALYIAMSGAKQNMLSQRGHANNLANANTTGFKSDFLQARSMPVFGEHYPSRAYAMTERPATDFEMGSLMQTGRDLDVAVAGKGWIAVQAPDGGEAYTREGELLLDVNGMLRTGSGLPVLGNGGPIAVPPAAKLNIGVDGTISIVPLGGNPDEIQEVDRIRLVNPPTESLEKGVDGLIHLKPDVPGPALPDGLVRLEPGYLESSNVNAVEEMTEILSLSRQFELQVKVMRAADDNTEAAARLLQIS
ncbi:flagellar basal body rod protein FlgF [Hahella aquimaris]|uniref:flagellar basal body rod protein FlgF n=1 Tax=Hahella sp. HNIBRBA332 TaxID=3015983 RepID=UPI00273B8AE6|nr:flagellar basal body rod protein FlgF [Hahella sp. HNIBRBA332]WLQ17306.1 flagellar basal body rod protein FlgF [Hahella sp. HNIBRBA332]